MAIYNESENLFYMHIIIQCISNVHVHYIPSKLVARGMLRNKTVWSLDSETLTFDEDWFLIDGLTGSLLIGSNHPDSVVDILTELFDSVVS